MGPRLHTSELKGEEKGSGARRRYTGYPDGPPMEEEEEEDTHAGLLALALGSTRGSMLQAHPPTPDRTSALVGTPRPPGAIAAT